MGPCHPRAESRVRGSKAGRRGPQGLLPAVLGEGLGKAVGWDVHSGLQGCGGHTAGLAGALVSTAAGSGEVGASGSEDPWQGLSSLATHFLICLYFS